MEDISMLSETEKVQKLIEAIQILEQRCSTLEAKCFYMTEPLLPETDAENLVEDPNRPLEVSPGE